MTEVTNKEIIIKHLLAIGKYMPIELFNSVWDWANAFPESEPKPGSEAKYLLAYRTKYNEEIQKGLPIFKTKSEAESKVADLVKDIDVIIECWAERI